MSLKLLKEDLQKKLEKIMESVDWYSKQLKKYHEEAAFLRSSIAELEELGNARNPQKPE